MLENLEMLRQALLTDLAALHKNLDKTWTIVLTLPIGKARTNLELIHQSNVQGHQYEEDFDGDGLAPIQDSHRCSKLSSSVTTVRMKRKQLTKSQLLSVACPTGGVAVGMRCVLYSGGSRSGPHIGAEAFCPWHHREKVKSAS